MISAGDLCSSREIFLSCFTFQNREDMARRWGAKKANFVGSLQRGEPLVAVSIKGSYAMILRKFGICYAFKSRIDLMTHEKG